MYFPYLRGRQYELLALRELIGNDKLSDKIIPVIEPVKITSTLLSTIKAFTDNNKNLSLLGTQKLELLLQTVESLKIQIYLKP